MEQILNTLMAADESIFLFFNGMHHAYWDNFMMHYTGKFVWVAMYLMIIFAIYRKYKPNAATLVLLLLIATIGLSDYFCASCIRPYLERLRPSNPDNPLSQLTLIVDGYRGGVYGFPSCHAANSMALATFLSFLFKRRGFVGFIFGWGFVNGYTRLYLGVHYPGDLFVGGIIGCIIGLIVYSITSRFIKRLNDAERPNSTISIPLGERTIKLPICGAISTVGVATTTIIAIVSIWN